MYVYVHAYVYVYVYVYMYTYICVSAMEYLDANVVRGDPRNCAHI